MSRDCRHLQSEHTIYRWEDLCRYSWVLPCGTEGKLCQILWELGKVAIFLFLFFLMWATGKYLKTILLANKIQRQDSATGCNLCPLKVGVLSLPQATLHSCFLSFSHKVCLTLRASLTSVPIQIHRSSNSMSIFSPSFCLVSAFQYHPSSEVFYIYMKPNDLIYDSII